MSSINSVDDSRANSPLLDDVFFSAPSTPISSRSSTPMVEQLAESDVHIQSIAQMALSENSIIENGSNLISYDMTEDQKVRINRILSRLPLLDRSIFITQAQLLITDDMDGAEQVEVIRALAQVPVQDRANFIIQLRSLMILHMDGEYKSVLICRLAEMPLEEMSTFIEQVKTVIPDDETLITDDLDGGYRCEILLILETIPVEHRANFITQVQRLIAENMDIYARYVFVLALSGVDGGDRDNFVEQVLSMVPHVIVDRDWVDSILDFAHLAVDRRSDFVANVINHSSSPTVEAFIVDPDSEFQTNSISLLLNFLEQILDHNHQLPTIAYVGSQGIDAGGLTRDFISRLFRSLCSQTSQLPMKITDEGLLLKIDEEAFLPKGNQIRCLKAIGIIFGAALVNQGFTTGLYFHPVMFKMIRNLSLEEIDAILQDLSDSQQLNPQTLHKLLQPLLIALYPDQFPDADALDEALASNTQLETLGTTMSEFLDDYPELKNIALAIAIIAKAMKGHLVEDDASKLLVSCQTLSNTIQGITVSRENILTSLGNDPSADQLKRWVDQATDDQLKQFVFFVTGATALQPGVLLTVNLLNANDL
ncbi:MAG: hypothetical protein WCG10_06775, partial [Chlamydiota bacterium]